MRILIVLLVLSLSSFLTVVAAPRATGVHDLTQAPADWHGGSGDDESDDESSDEPIVLVAEYFLTDPATSFDAVIAGEPAGRLTWQPDDPAFPGDVPGSLTALYDSSLPTLLFGLALQDTLDESRTFTAGAVLVIEPEGFVADPSGFAQISWGLWNSIATGLDRTGTLETTADCYELVEFDWFPNQTAFGGPFISPAVFGVADPPGGDAFGNFSTLFDLEATLPLGVPLLVVIEHRPGPDAAVAQVYRIVGEQEVTPVDGAVALAPLDGLAPRQYELDAVGLTLWKDGFDGLFGPSPAVRASVVYHAVVLVEGLVGRPEDLLNVPGE